MERRKTLEELIKKCDHPPVVPDVFGYVTATLRDTLTGRIKKQVSQKNLVTDAYYVYRLTTAKNINSLKIVISNDDEDPHYYKHYSFSTFQDTEYIADAQTLDYVNKIYTYNASFTGVTAPGRTVSKVNLCTDNVTVVATYAKIHYSSLTSVKLNSSIFQTPSDTLEIVYRLSFVRI